MVSVDVKHHVFFLPDSVFHILKFVEDRSVFCVSYTEVGYRAMSCVPFTEDGRTWISGLSDPFLSDEVLTLW